MEGKWAFAPFPIVIQFHHAFQQCAHPLNRLPFPFLQKDDSRSSGMAVKVVMTLIMMILCRSWSNVKRNELAVIFQS